MDKDSPNLIHRRSNRKSTIKSGRTIGEKREHLETKNERIAARKKDKAKKVTRVFFSVFIFAALIAALVALYFLFFTKKPSQPADDDTASTYIPKVEILDASTSAPVSEISSRMKAYIGQAEKDFRDLGYTPQKVVIPTGSIREVDFYLDGQTGFIKMLIDRNTAVSVEDADRMLRYLSDQGVTDFTYIDVRIDGKAYWK